GCGEGPAAVPGSSSGRRIEGGQATDPGCRGPARNLSLGDREPRATDPAGLARDVDAGDIGCLVVVHGDDQRTVGTDPGGTPESDGKLDSRGEAPADGQRIAPNRPVRSFPHPPATVDPGDR